MENSRSGEGGRDGSERRNLKRKIEDVSVIAPPFTAENSSAIVEDVKAHISVLKQALSSQESDRLGAKRAAHALAELARHEEHVDLLVEHGVVDALVPHLSPPASLANEGGLLPPSEHEVEKEACLALGLLAVKPEHQRLIADAGALPHLITLLQRRPPSHLEQLAHHLAPRPSNTPSSTYEALLTSCVLPTTGVVNALAGAHHIAPLPSTTPSYTAAAALNTGVVSTPSVIAATGAPGAHNADLATALPIAGVVSSRTTLADAISAEAAPSTAGAAAPSTAGAAAPSTAAEEEASARGGVVLAVASTSRAAPLPPPPPTVDALTSSTAVDSRGDSNSGSIHNSTAVAPMRLDDTRDSEPIADAGVEGPVSPASLSPSASPSSQAAAVLSAAAAPPPPAPAPASYALHAGGSYEPGAGDAAAPPSLPPPVSAASPPLSPSADAAAQSTAPQAIGRPSSSSSLPAHLFAPLLAVNSLIRRAADAITNLAHENGPIKCRIRAEGAIPPLVALLDNPDSKVQRAAAGSLRTLAFKNEANKAQIIDCGALPTLVFMMRSEDVGIHYEAVGVIGNLVHSSAKIKRQVLDAGALQPVVCLLSSSCQETQREAALLLGQFATTDPECKVRIVQRGAVRPLIRMLHSHETQVREMAAFALGRLAQNSDNQAGIVLEGGLPSLLELLEAKNGNLQHNAAFAIYGLADNEDNISEIVKADGIQKLMDAELLIQASKECVQKTLKRLEEKINGRVLRHLLYLLRCSADLAVQQRVATALAHMGAEEDQRTIFVTHAALEILLSMLVAQTSSPPPTKKLTNEAQEQQLLQCQKQAARALFTLAKRAAALSPIDTAPLPPTPQVYLGEQYVNNQTLSDVTFLVEGTRFYAHRIALLASSDAFRAMFDGGYREKEAQDVEIPNISWPVFERMMRCIYTGTVEVPLDMAQDLLRAADQYLLDGLKRLCEYAIAQDLSAENVAHVYELSDAYHAQSLRHTCLLYVLEHHDEMCGSEGFSDLVGRMVPELRLYFHRVLRPRQETPQP